MKLKLRPAFFTLAITLFAATIASTQTGNGAGPSADDVAAKMTELDAQRQSELTASTATRRCMAINKSRHAEMILCVTCDSSGFKQFSILSEQGSGSIRRHVSRKSLSEETEASRHGARNGGQLTPANYDFQLVGQEALKTGSAYTLAVSPKTANRYLLDGKIWVDANDYSIIRTEGQRARNPSFWVRSVHVVHTYQKVGPFWFASATHTKGEIRVFGSSKLTIRNSGYALNRPIEQATEPGSEVRLIP